MWAILVNIAAIQRDFTSLLSTDSERFGSAYVPNGNALAMLDLFAMTYHEAMV